MFTVEIENTKKVGILRDLIKEKKAPRLNHIDANDSDLWHVDLSNNPPTDGMLKPRNLLSDVFPSELEECSIHFIVCSGQRWASY